MSIEDNVKSWVTLDNNIKILNDQIKVLRNKKNIATNNIFSLLENKNIKNINISDGKLNLACINNYETITYKFLYECFAEYFKNNEQSEDLVNFIQNKRLIIHNAEFDLAHLNNELELLGKSKIQNQIIDTLVLAREKFPGSQASLDALCKRYRIDNSRRTHHSALIDCDLLAKVYINLIDQKEPKLDFNNNQENLDPLTSKVNYYKKITIPNSEEIKKHKEYLKLNLKKNYF